MAGPQVSQIVCPKRQMQLINSFPEEIIFDILVRLPAHVLYDVMRYVCRQWHRIIDDPQFVSTHFQMASSTLLMYSPKKSRYYLLDVTECHAKLSGFEFQSPSIYSICTCNELVLIRRIAWLQRNIAHYVGNPITRTLLALPQLPLSPTYSGIAFEASSKVYKVVVVYRTEKYSRKPLNLDYGCAILTLGIDEVWRFLNCAHLTKRDMRLLIRRPPITSIDFVYWVSTSNPYMLALDLKSESIKRILLPLPLESLKDLKYLAKGNSISVWYPKLDYSMEVWVLKDYISEKWVKFLCIDGEPIRNEMGKVMTPGELASSRNFVFILPRCWLGNGEKILFDAGFHTSYLFVYDLKTRGCCPFDVEYDEKFCSILQPFSNSLTWIC